MNEQPEVLCLVRQWVGKAEEDLTNAEYTLTMRENCPFSTICFHAQQCVEKYLKALLTQYGEAFPRTHDLLELVRLMPGPVKMGLRLREISLINRYAVEARHPGNWEPITRADAEEAVVIAQEVRAVILPFLCVSGNSPAQDRSSQ